MKKILFMFVAVFSIIACNGGSTSNNSNSKDSVDTSMVDTICGIDSIAE